MNRDQFFHLVSARPQAELEMIQQAYWLAKHAHRKQKRDGGGRYFEHPRRVAIRAIKAGYDSTEQIVLCFLHDVVEDTDTPLTVIVTLFGAEMWKRLLLISKKIPVFDPVTGEVRGRTKKAIKQYFAEIAAADIVVRRGKLLDREDNMSDMRAFTYARRMKYLRETRRFLLPIAKETDVQLFKKLDALCKQVAADLKKKPTKLVA
jgi:guanosine-3',5'-bis(diphosphate) 3'-pyrophosphohydrolase